MSPEQLIDMLHQLREDPQLMESYSELLAFMEADIKSDKPLNVDALLQIIARCNRKEQVRRTNQVFEMLAYGCWKNAIMYQEPRKKWWER